MSMVQVKRADGMFEVYVAGSFVKAYSSPDNAMWHAMQISDAINSPKGLNQAPRRMRKKNANSSS